jgi:hypothetical protein
MGLCKVTWPLHAMQLKYLLLIMKENYYWGSKELEVSLKGRVSFELAESLNYRNFKLPCEFCTSFGKIERIILE